MVRRGSTGVGVSCADRRGLATPSLPLVVAVGLLVSIALTAAAFSLGLVDVGFGAPTEVTTEFNESVVTDGETVAVTVVEEGNRDPVTDVTVVAVGESASLDAAPEVPVDADGRAVFELGEGEDAIDVDWGSTQRDGEIGFEVRSLGEGRVDDRENSVLTVLRD